MKLGEKLTGILSQIANEWEETQRPFEDIIEEIIHEDDELKKVLRILLRNSYSDVFVFVGGKPNAWFNYPINDQPRHKSAVPQWIMGVDYGL